MHLDVAILGCGPTGLFAAHAMAQLGHDITIYSRKRRSEMFGAQYLHRPIPGLLLSDPITIDYQLQGTADGYRSKVYSGQDVDSVSPESLVGQHKAWDIREAYYCAWKLYYHKIKDVPRIDAKWVRNELVWNQHHVVVSSIPATSLCYDRGHKFNSAYILAMGDAPERGSWVPDWVDCPDSAVICNGDPEVSWYRQSNIYGYRTVEWPEDARINEEHPVARVEKPIDTDCDCFANSIVRAGRYGRWEKGYLSHQAYFETMEALG